VRRRRKRVPLESRGGELPEAATPRASATTSSHPCRLPSGVELEACPAAPIDPSEQEKLPVVAQRAFLVLDHHEAGERYRSAGQASRSLDVTSTEHKESSGGYLYSLLTLPQVTGSTPTGIEALAPSEPKSSHR
jgi:hypothetical protein